MKTVLSNTKRFLAVFLALAMVVLAVPNAPTDLLAAEVDPEVEAVETTEAEAPVDTAEDVAAPAEDVAAPAEEAEANDAVDAEEPVVDDAAVGEEVAEEEPVVDAAALGLTETADLFIVGEAGDGDEAVYSTVLNSTAGDPAKSGEIVIAVGHTATAVASQGWVNDSNTDREKNIMKAGGEASWWSVDPKVATVETTADRTATITAVAPGVTYINGTYTNNGTRHTVTYNEGTGELYTALKVTVVDLTVDPTSTTGKVDEKTGVTFLNLDTIEAVDEDGNPQVKLAEDVYFEITCTGNVATGNTTWRSESEVSNDHWTGLDVIATENGASDDGYYAQFKASETGGLATVWANYTPVDGVTPIKLEKDIFVTNYTVGISAKHGTDPVEVDYEDLAYTCPTGNSWVPYEETIQVGTDNAVTYPLSAFDSLGVDVTDEVEFIDNYARKQSEAFQPINLSVTFDNTAKTMTIQGLHESADESFQIFAKKKVTSDDKNPRVVGMVTAHVTVANDAAYSFVKDFDSDDKVADADAYGFLSAVHGTGNGYNSNDGSEIDLYTTGTVVGKRIWTPKTSTILVKTVTYNGGHYTTENEAAMSFFQNRGSDQTFGTEIIKAAVENKSIDDIFAITSVGIGQQETGVEMDADTNPGEYTVTLNVVPANESATMNFTPGSYDKKSGVAFSGDKVIYDSNIDPDGGTKYSESTATLVLDGDEGGTLTLDDPTITRVGDGVYVNSIPSVGVYNLSVVDIGADGKTLIARAPGEAYVSATYKNAAGKRWAMPIHVVVEKGDVNDLALAVTANDEDILSTSSTDILAATSMAGKMITSGMKYTYTVTDVEKADDGDALTKDEKIALLKLVDGTYDPTVGTIGAVTLADNYGPKCAFGLKEENGLNRKVLYTVSVQGILFNGTTPEGYTSVETTKVRVIPTSAATISLATATDAFQYLQKGDTTTSPTLDFNNESGIELEATGYDEKVVDVNVEGPNGLTITALDPGKTTVNVRVKGSTLDPVAITCEVFGVKGDGVTWNEDTDRYELTLAEVGDVYTDSTITLYSDTDKAATSWKQDGSLQLIKNKDGSVNVTLAGSLPPHTAVPLSASYAVPGTVYDNTDFVKLYVDSIITTVTATVDDDTKDISAETPEDSSEWTIVPKVVYSYDKKAVEGPDYTLVPEFTSGKGFVTLTSTTVDGLAALQITPVKLGTATVDVKVMDKDNPKKQIAVIPSITINVNAKPVFTEENDIPYDKSSTGTYVPHPVSVWALTNYAVTAVDASDYATKTTTKPTLAQAMLYNTEGKEFNTGWSFGDNSDMYVSDAVQDGTTAKIPAVYEIKGIEIQTQDVTVTTGTIDGIELSNSELVPVSDGVYEAKLDLGGQSSYTVGVNPIVYDAEDNKSDASEFKNLFDEHIKTTASSSDAKVAMIDKIKTAKFNLNPTEKAGTAVVTVKEDSYSAKINVATGENLATLLPVNGSTAGSATTDPYLVSSPSNPTWLKKDNSYAIDKYGSVGVAQIKVAIATANAATENGGMSYDASKKGIVYVDSSNPDVATVQTSTMQPYQTTSDYVLYSAQVVPKEVGWTTLTVRASDSVGTTKRLTLFVTEGMTLNVADATVYNTKKSEKSELEIVIPTNEFFNSKKTAADDKVDGYVVKELNIGNNPNNYFTPTNVIDPKTQDITWSIGFANTSTKVPAGTYDLTLFGKTQLYYYGHDNNWHPDGQLNNFSSIPLKVVVSDEQFVTPTVADVTLAQGETADLNVTFDEVGWDVTSIAFDDVAAAAEAGLSISGSKLTAAGDANIVSSKNYDVTVTAKKTEGTDTATGKGTVKISVTKADLPTVSIGATSVKQGGTAQLSAVWSNTSAVTKSYEMEGISNGLSVSSTGLLTASKDAPVSTTPQMITVKVKGTLEPFGDIEATTTVAVTVTDKDPIVVDVTMSDVSIRQNQTKNLGVSKITSGFKATKFEFADPTAAAAAGLTITDDNKLVAAETATIDKTGKQYAFNVTVTNGTDTVVTTASATIIVNEASGGGDHDIEPTPDTEEGLDDITNETYKAYQVESSFDLTNKNATTTVYFVGNVDPDGVEVISNYFEEVDEIVGMGYTKVVLALKNKTWDSAKDAAKNGKKVEFKLTKGDSVAAKQPKVTLKATATAPKMNLTVKSGTAYPNEGGFFGTWQTDDKNGNLVGSDVVYVSAEGSPTAVEDVTVVGGNLINFNGTNEYPKGGLYVTNSDWVDGLSAFASFKITKAKANAQPVIKLGKKNTTLKNAAGQIFSTPITVGGMTLNDGEITVEGAPEKVNAVYEGGQLWISTEEGVAAGTYNLTVNTATDASVTAKKAETFKLVITDKDAKVTYSVKGKLDSIADDTYVWVTPKLTNASGTITLPDETVAALKAQKLTASVVGDTIVIGKDASAFDGSVQFIAKGNIVLNNFKINIGDETAVANKLTVPVIQGKLTATGSAVDFRGKSDVTEGSSAIEAVYTYSVYNAKGKAYTKNYYTFTGDALTLTDAKTGKMTATTTTDGLVKVNNLKDGKDVNCSVKVGIKDASGIKAVSAKFKVLGKVKK